MLCTLDFSLCYAAFYDSRSKSLVCKNLMLKGVNPCFNGRYSQSCKRFSPYTFYRVLILVLMEDTLREQRLVSLCLSSFDVCLPL